VRARACVRARARHQAIKGCTTSHTLYTNRALCNQKLHRWCDVESDAHAAILCRFGGCSSVKAHYLLGKALLEQGKLEEAKEALLKSMSLSSSPDFKSYRGSIEAALFLARKKMWHKTQEGLDLDDERLVEELQQLAQSCCSSKGGGQRDDAADEAADDDVMSTYHQAPKEDKLKRINAISQLLSRARVKRNVMQIPSGMVCKLTHRIMLDPLTTPFGQTYEKEALEKHLLTASSDPFKASQRFSASQLMPNLALKRFIDEFLEEHPWAYDEENR